MILKPGTKEYQAEASRRSYQKRKEAVKKRAIEWNNRQRLILRDILLARKAQGCQDCKGYFHPEAMEFDHVRGVKRDNISTLVSSGKVSVETLEAELAKCELVCANCHRVRSYNRRASVTKIG